MHGERKIERQLLNDPELAENEQMFAALALLLFVAGAANAQMVSRNAMQAAESKSCPLATFAARTRAVEKACCAKRALRADPNCKPGKAPSACTMACAEVFVPFYDACKATLGRYFDGDDGREDNKAAGFDTLFGKCTGGKDVPLAVVFDRVKDLRNEGCRVDLGQEQGGRHLQIIGNAIKKTNCQDMKSLDLRARDVDTACCRTPGSCPNQVPRTCSADCGMVLPAFLKDCNLMIKVALATMVPKLQQGASECANIPTHGIITAIANAKCGNGWNAPPPPPPPQYTPPPPPPQLSSCFPPPEASHGSWSTPQSLFEAGMQATLTCIRGYSTTSVNT